MIIKKVCLKNFRVHKDREFEFKPGINLLLGKNGTGKSSIFEALSVAFFSKSPRGTLNSIITNDGSKKAQIKVEFIASDGKEYVLEKSIGQSKSSLYSKDGSLKYEGKEDISEYIKTIVGINEEVFNKVIYTYQNQLTDIFSKTPAERKQLFDRLFETDVYREISDKLFKVQQSYEKDLEVNKVELEKIKLELESEEFADLEERIKSHEEKLEEVKNEIENLRAEVQNLRKRQKSLEDIIESYKRIKKDLQMLEKEKEHLNSKLDDLNKRLENAKKAKDIVEKTKKGYEMYLELEKEVRRLNTNQKELQGKKREKETLQDKRNELEKSKSVLESQISSLKEKKVEIEKRISEKDEKISDLKKEILKLDEYLKNLLDDQSKLSAEIEEFNKRYEDLGKLKVELQHKYLKISEEEKLSFNRKLLEDEISRLMQQIEEVKKNISYEDQLVQDLANLRARLENIKNVSRELSSGICPILKEECKNVKEKGGFEVYIVEKEEIEEEISELEKSLKMLGDLKKKREELEKNVKEKEIELSNINLKLEEIEREKESIKSIENILKTQNYEDMEKIKKEYEGKYLSLVKQISATKERKNSIEKEHEKYLREIVEEDEKLKDINEKISLFNESFEKTSKELEQVEKSLVLYGDIEKDMESTMNSIEEKQKEMDKLRKDFDMYKKFEKEAQMLGDILEEIKDTKKKIEESQKSASILEKELEKIHNIEEIEREKNNLVVDIDKINEKLSEFSQQVGKLEENVKFLNRERERKKRLENEKRELESKRNFLEEKKKLTKEFREKLRDLGMKVAHRISDEISNLSTVNYNIMTGKVEMIEFSAENDYEVILKNFKESVERTFSMLSGGEQVSVAIAIRAALSKILSKSDFYILDEPTINLDVERKKLLAENIEKLFEDVKQVFIITHDEEFTHMAENIIRL